MPRRASACDELVIRRNVVGLDEDVLLFFQLRLNLLVDRQQGFVDVLAAVFSMHQRNRRTGGQGRERVRVARQHAVGVARRLGLRRLRQLLLRRNVAASEHGSGCGPRQMKQIPA